MVTTPSQLRAGHWMNNHKHARLTRLGRALLVNRVMQQNWTMRQANSQHRADAMKSWLHHYNWHRPHQGIGRAVPISRLNLDEYNLLTVHT
ncbi:integrase core domain protein [Bordetella pertussis H918]|nr:integrase core domain protein [Bordetella pertussis H918]